MHQVETGELRDIFDNAQREHQEELMTLEQQNRAEAKLLQEGMRLYETRWKRNTFVINMSRLN